MKNQGAKTEEANKIPNTTLKETAQTQRGFFMNDTDEDIDTTKVEEENGSSPQ